MTKSRVRGGVLGSGGRTESGESYTSEDVWGTEKQTDHVIGGRGANVHLVFWRANTYPKYGPAVVGTFNTARKLLVFSTINVLLCWKEPKSSRRMIYKSEADVKSQVTLSFTSEKLGTKEWKNSELENKMNPPPAFLVSQRKYNSKCKPM